MNIGILVGESLELEPGSHCRSLDGREMKSRQSFCEVDIDIFKFGMQIGIMSGVVTIIDQKTGVILQFTSLGDWSWEVVRGAVRIDYVDCFEKFSVLQGVLKHSSPNCSVYKKEEMNSDVRRNYSEASSV